MMHPTKALSLLFFFVCVNHALPKGPLSHTINHINSNNEYTAAVVEYSPITNFNPNISKEEAVGVMLENVKEYEKMVYQARLKGAQIIVFPEYGNICLFINDIVAY